MQGSYWPAVGVTGSSRVKCDMAVKAEVYRAVNGLENWGKDKHKTFW